MPSTPHEHNMETKTSLQTPNNHKEWAASMISAIREKNRTNDSPKFHTLVANVEQMLDESDLEKIQLFGVKTRTKNSKQQLTENCISWDSL